MSEAKAGGAVSTYTIIGTVDSTGKAQAVSSTTGIPVDTGAASGLITGQGRKTVTTAGTPLALAASTACKWVVVQALVGNSSAVAVGITGVVAASGTETGAVLNPGASVTIPVANLATVFVDSRVNGEGVSYFYGV